LKQLRTDCGLTQRDLADKVGLRYYTFISQIEAGQGRIPADQFKAWADALGMEPAAFAKTLMKYYDPVTYALLFPGE
jgi:transcriptional regulator with XRE-family HTH domain